MREGLDIPSFGYLPFDHFVVVSPLSLEHIYDNKFIPSSPTLGKLGCRVPALQKRAEKKPYREMDRAGNIRTKRSYLPTTIYPLNEPHPLTNKPQDYVLAMFDDDIMEQLIDHPPTGVPQDLLSENDRARSGLITSTLWIRTWFGDPTDKTSQEAADTAYARLRKEVLQRGDENNNIYCMFEEFIFEDRQELSADAQRGEDIVGGVAVGRPGSVPGYLIAAQMHLADLFDGTSDRPWRHFTGEERAESLAESDRTQSALVVVADRKACEEGWVLVLAVNHRGEILPFRVRERAKEAAKLMSNWDDEVPLADIVDDEDEDVECYLGEGDGWESQ
ncbi:uncharacterized protein KD926_008149 [Aspergillus affinis]|uniref:uncharacterized protein n=1 Tax=Aspergillus affinis TaxID=1070780 RepID=UPI0022FF4515|nr:uncharacterized protein KD926_008149 [Aspergillus affinis]KAI9040582.1 hypothetical protein KD926_008149 [Aspergillus affinis]